MTVFAEPTPLADVPPLPEGTVLFDGEARFAQRGRIGGYAMRPSKYGIYPDRKVHREGSEESIFVRYRKLPYPSFCGTYLIVVGDLSQYATMSFWIKGAAGGEAFEIGMNDVISNKREDAVIVGSIYRYLPGGVTTEWQEVRVPLSDFFGVDLARVYSVVLNFNEEGEGAFWVDGFTFHREVLVYRENQIEMAGQLLLDDFNHSDVNLLGRKANAYKRLPSVCTFSREAVSPSAPTPGVDQDIPGVEAETNRALRLDFEKASTGWCGYYTLLNQIDGAYYDLSGYKEVAFFVRGAQGGELFEIGMADRSWLTIGDSVKAGEITRYLPKGVTTEWQEVVISLSDFGKLDWTQMGSFVINFNRPGEGVIYIDNLRFIRKTEQDLLREWEEVS